MKATIKRKVIGLAMSLAMACTMMPQLGMTAYGAAGDPAMVIGTGVLESTSNTANAQTVYMADIPWRVIGYGSSGVASGTNTMTLISAGNIKNDVQFKRYSDADLTCNYYNGSILQTEVNAIADTFSDGEEAGIARRILYAGDYMGVDTDTIARQRVTDARLWPLSTREANSVLNRDLRNIEGDWWLRSPGSDYIFAAYVDDVDDFDYEGCRVDEAMGLRPAFNYKLDSVIFTSAATGGKSSGTVGADALKTVGTNEGSEWKLTVKSGHDNFKVDSVTTCDGKTLNIKYSGAATGNNEYISAIIKNSEGNVTCYGNLKNCAAETDASGTVKVKVENKLGENGTLYVFNEQLNGNNETDFASELKEVTIPESITHEMTHHAAVAPTCTEDGTVEYWSCENCNKNFEDEQGANELTTIVDSKTGHNMTHHAAVTATCTEDGNVEYWSCANCQKNFGDAQGTTELPSIVDPKTGHKMTHHAAVAPKCTEDGTVEYWSCGNCSKNFGDEQGTNELTTIVAPKTGHKYGEWTKLDDKQHQRVCEHNPSHTEEADHTWDAGVVTEEPTITEEGKKLYTCTACGAKRTEAIPKLPKNNTLKIKAKTTKVKYKKLKKKTQKLAVTKVIKFTDKGQGKMTYKLLSAKKGKKSFKKYIKINAKNGQVTIKKNKKMKKGTYKVKIQVKAAGNAEYKASSWKTVTYKIKVK